MKLSFFLLLSSSAILAASAGYSFVCLTTGVDITGQRPFDPETDTLKLGSMSFQEAKDKLEHRVEADYALSLIGIKYETYKGWLKELAQGKDDRGFLVLIELYKTYQRKLEQVAREKGDHNSLALLRKDKIEVFLAAAAQNDLFKVEAILRWGNLQENDFPELMDKAAAEGHDSMVAILLKDNRSEDFLLSLWRNIKPGTKLSDLLFMALLDRADGETHKNILVRCSDREDFEEKRKSLIAVLLAYGKLEGFDFLKLKPKTEKDQDLKAIYKADPRIGKVMGQKVE